MLSSSGSVRAEASEAAKCQRAARNLSGLVRMPVSDLMGARSTALCDELLLRQIAVLEATAPALAENLFGDVLSSTRH